MRLRFSVDRILSNLHNAMQIAIHDVLLVHILQKWIQIRRQALALSFELENTTPQYHHPLNNVNFLHLLNYSLFKTEVMLSFHFISPHHGVKITEPIPYTISHFSFRPARLSPCNFLSILVLPCQVSYCQVRGCCSIILSFSSRLSPFSYI